MLTSLVSPRTHLLPGLWEEETQAWAYGEAAGGSQPVLSSLGAGEVGAFTASPFVVTDTGSGTIYVVATTSATQPSTTQIAAGQDHLGASAVWANSVSPTGTGARGLGLVGGLTHDTSGYYLHAYQNANSLDSDVVSSSSFATEDANPTGASAGPISATGTIDPGINTGTVWWVMTESGTAPSIAQVQAGQDNSGSAATDDGSESATSPSLLTINATGVEDTTYYFHYQYEDVNNVDSPVLSSGSFTLVEEPSGGGASAKGDLIKIGAGVASPPAYVSVGNPVRDYRVSEE